MKKFAIFKKVGRDLQRQDCGFIHAGTFIEAMESLNPAPGKYCVHRVRKDGEVTGEFTWFDVVPPEPANRIRVWTRG